MTRRRPAFLLAVALALSASFARAQDVDELKAESDKAFDGRTGMPELMRRRLRETGQLVIPKPETVHRAPGELVDLHAHLFMEHGLGFLFQGGFNGPLQSRNWTDLLSSQANPETLDASALGLVVAALYAHPVLTPARHSSIRDQIAEARAFVASNPDWVLATSPSEARAAHAAGKRIMVLSLEGASGILDTEDDLKEFIDRGGIRIVTFAHISDDKLTGAAMMNGYHVLGNPRGLVGALGSPRGPYGELQNPHGLTLLGRAIVTALLKRGVWIDIAHSPDSAQAELIPMLMKAGQPLLYTHTALRRYRKVERGLSDVELQWIRASGGILGLVPSAEALEGTPLPPGACPAGCHCEGTVYALAVQFEAAAREIGPSSVFLGSDFNGASDHLKPTGCSTNTTLDLHGFHQIGQTSELWSLLRKAGAPAQASSFHGVEHFIDVWERASQARP